MGAHGSPSGAHGPHAPLGPMFPHWEKLLFRENAKCTLYGTSDVVTAIGKDDITDTLHVGTSSGRSEFRGLNRINNTTTAVATAIAASDGLVAEQ